MSFWLWIEDPNRFINRRNEISVCTSDAISPKKEILRPNFLAQWSTRDGFKRFSNPLKWVIYIIWEVFTERILIAIKGIFCISILVPISITPRASGTKQHGFSFCSPNIDQTCDFELHFSESSKYPVYFNAAISYSLYLSVSVYAKVHVAFMFQCQSSFICTDQSSMWLNFRAFTHSRAHHKRIIQKW